MRSIDTTRSGSIRSAAQGGEHQREQRDVPTMLGRILTPRTVGDTATTDDGFEAVGLKEEAKPRGERLVEPGQQRFDGHDALFLWSCHELAGARRSPPRIRYARKNLGPG